MGYPIHLVRVLVLFLATLHAEAFAPPIQRVTSFSRGGSSTSSSSSSSSSESTRNCAPPLGHGLPSSHVRCRATRAASSRRGINLQPSQAGSDVTDVDDEVGLEDALTATTCTDALNDPRQLKDEPAGGEESAPSVSTLGRIRILSYRTTLLASGLLLTTTAIFGSSFLSGTGVDGTSVTSWADGLLPFAAGLAALLAPMPEDGLGKAARLATAAIGAAAIGAALISSVGGFDGGANTDDIGDVQRILSIVSLMAICLREIYYFGLAYKVEAVVALLTLPLLLVDADDYNLYPLLAVSLCAMAVDVLAVGKVFEPCGEDYVRSNSEFLAGDSNRE